MSLKLRPLGDRIVVEVIEKEKLTKSGIIIPDSAQENSEQGVISEVGPGRMSANGLRIPMDVKVGDKIMFKSWGGEDYVADGKAFKIMTQDDVLCVIVEEKKGKNK